MSTDLTIPYPTLTMMTRIRDKVRLPADTSSPNITAPGTEHHTTIYNHNITHILAFLEGKKSRSKLAETTK